MKHSWARMSTSLGQSKKQVLPIQLCSCLMHLGDKRAPPIYACHRAEQHRKKDSPHHGLLTCLERYWVSAGSILGTKIPRWPAFCHTLGRSKLIYPTFLYVLWTWYFMVSWIIKELSLIHAQRKGTTLFPGFTEASSPKRCLLPITDTEERSTSAHSNNTSHELAGISYRFPTA